jgi:hypothetical protein
VPLHDVSASYPLGTVLDYVERVDNTSVSSTATSAGTAVAVLDGHTFEVSGTTLVEVEVYIPNLTCSGGNVGIVELFDGASDLGRMGQGGPGATGEPMILKSRVSLAAGAHTFHAKLWTNSGTATVTTGGGTYISCYMNVTKVS